MTGRPRRSRWSRPAKAVTIAPGVGAVKETVLQSRVGGYVTGRGGLHYHTHNSERSEGGFPDSVIVGNWVMFRELKSDSDSATVSKKQRLWIERLRAAGCDVDVWWPVDWESGRIQAEIDACTRKRRPSGALELADLAKTLYVLAQTGVDPNAGLHWDAGSRHVDRVTWQLNADTVRRNVAHALPRTEAEVQAWLARHEITDAGVAGAVLEALRGDLLRTNEGDLA